MSKVPKKILVDFFFDVVSPYAYISFEVIHRCNKKWQNMDLQLKPVFLGGIIAATGNLAPRLVPKKASYMDDDLMRLAQFYNMPFRLNSQKQKLFFEKGTLATQRMLAVVKKYHPDKLEALSYEMYRRTWAHDEDITVNGALKSACISSGFSSKEADAILTESKRNSGKQGLKALTQEALDFGTFGVPTFIAHSHKGQTVFFGCDRIFLLGSFLGQEWPGIMADLNKM